ncbi:ribosomal protein S25, putative [Pediculus humanus corporis]|uniref:Small ribosomal subunit protein mS25 n=1 Tax=Pediculus humanus subsp. corporis TaxID=121224 RepID=E0VEN1_PEDHC|nr:ribosomal protein S25, putative [Pediculus humanus corporis]EEB11837.1 ribosomal protein S25, putative [Pediculus humanus corporis]
MPFMIGKSPIRRTLKYLEKGKIFFRENVKIFAINYNSLEKHHKGAREFVFWHLPQIQYKNRNVQCICFKNLTPSPFIQVYFENGDNTLIDIDSRKREEILDHLSNCTFLCKTRDEVEETDFTEKLQTINFGYNCKKHCICEVMGQVPCTSLVAVPKIWRGILKPDLPYNVPPHYMK